MSSFPSVLVRVRVAAVSALTAKNDMHHAGHTTIRDSDYREKSVRKSKPSSAVDTHVCGTSTRSQTGKERIQLVASAKQTAYVVLLRV
eukprot:COSAG06_NODE_28486_length_573_cov_1.040084_1_plen_87_part_10